MNSKDADKLHYPDPESKPYYAVACAHLENVQRRVGQNPERV